MQKCPVCDKTISQQPCQNCGFDGSCNYEQYPSLAALRQQTSAISARRAALEQKSEPVPPKPDDYISSSSVVQQIQQDSLRKKEPVPPPVPAPKPKPAGNIGRVLSRVLCAAIGIGIASAVLAAVSGPKKEPDLDVTTLPISEDVKTLITAGTEDTYTYMDGSVVELYFDSRDLETARIYKDKDDAIEYVFTAEYDADGNILEHLTFDSTGTLTRTDSYRYTPDGAWTEHVILLEDGIMGRRFVRRFLSEDMLESYAEYAADGSLVDEEHYQYDAEGNSAATYYLDGSSDKSTIDQNGNHWLTWLDAEGNVTGMWGYRLDENDLLTEDYDYDADGQLLSWSEHHYDAHGNETGRTWYHADGTIERVQECEYDSQGNLVLTREYNPDGSMNYETTKVYGPRNMEIGSRQASYGASPSIWQYEDVESILGTVVKSFSQQRSDAGVSNRLQVYDSMENRITYLSYDPDGLVDYEVHTEYDINGNTTNETEFMRLFHDNGKPSSEHFTEEDTLGNRVTRNRFFDEDGKLTGSNESEEHLDAQGNSTTTVKYYDQDGKLESSSQRDIQHDAQGNSTEISKSYDQNDRLTYESISREDAQGNSTETVKHYDQDGKLKRSSQQDIQYDAQGNSTEISKSYDQDGTLTYESIQQQDSQGNYVMTFKYYDDDGILTRITETERTYGQDGTSIQTDKTYDGEGRVTETADLKYDADNNAISGERVNIYYYNDGTKTVITYDHNYERIREENYDASGKLIS